MWVKASMNSPLKQTPNEADYKLNPLQHVAYFRQAFPSTLAKLALLQAAVLLPAKDHSDGENGKSDENRAKGLSLVHSTACNAPLCTDLILAAKHPREATVAIIIYLRIIEEA